MKKDNGFRIIIILAVLGLSIWSLIPTLRVFSRPADANLPLEERAREKYKRENPEVANNAINLGLDLAGGTHIIVEVKKDKLPEDEQKDVVDRSLEIIRNRVDQYGLSEPVITRTGENRIVADLAGMGAEDARRLIGATALLEFKLVAEVQEFTPILEKIDGYLNRQAGASPISTGAPKDSTEAAVQDLFGRAVAQDTTKVAPKAADSSAAQDSVALAAAEIDSTGKSDTSASDTADLAAFYKDKPFTSLLVGMDRDVGVKVGNVEKVSSILKNPEIQKLIPPTKQFLWSREVETLRDGTKVKKLYLLKRRAEMTGKYISDATFNRVTGGMDAGEMEVALSFKGIGPKEFGRITGANIDRQLAIVLDSVVYSAPVIQGKISQGRASITGIGDINEAKQLAVTLRAGSLPAPMEIVELRSVGPTLGEENIQKGMLAAIVSLVLIAVFMITYYMNAGIIANIALIFNMIIIFAVLSAFHATLTLPGIAGIVLTIGMAVDANVIIYERIREELAAGRTVRSSIDAGYKKAFSSIFDSNITTFGTAAVLYYIGTGPIKGFGLTLMIGIAASMFTAIYVTRLLFDVLVQRGDGKSLAIGRGFAFMRKVDLKVIPKAKYWVGVSTAMVSICLISILFIKGLDYGVDFKGGNVYQVQFPGKADVEQIRQKISSAGFSDPKVQTLGAVGGNEVLISIAKSDNDSLARQGVMQAVGDGKIVSEETVGPTIGKDLKKAALWSIFWCLLIIVLYIWFRFGRNGLGFGIGAVIALVYDSLVTLGMFSLLGMEISLTFVAAVLTIIGFSLNDTIVIFDRIRENTSGTGKDSFGSKVNTAVNQCFSRTVITSLTVLVTVVILAGMGGSSIRDFNIALIFGVISGVFSTLGVASPFVVWWEKRRSLAPAPVKKSPAMAK